MKILKDNIQTILFIVFEAVVGILLLTNPEAFTRTVIILFGIVLFVIGVICLVRFLNDRKRPVNNPLALIISVISLVFGAVCMFFSGAIIGLITAIAIIYGVILLIAGVCKIQNYFQSKKSGLAVSKVSIISGIIAIVLGIIVAVYPKSAAFSVWIVAGIVLLVNAAVDILSLILTARNRK